MTVVPSVRLPQSKRARDTNTPWFQRQGIYLIAGLPFVAATHLPWWCVTPFLAVLLTIPFLRSSRHRFIAAWSFFVVATNCITSSYTAFFPGGSGVAGLFVWLVVAVLLALPWAFAKGPVSTLVAAALSGVLGPLSIWPLAGVLFPGMGLVGFFVLAALLWMAGDAAVAFRGDKPAEFTAGVFPLMIAAIVLSNVTAVATSVWGNPALYSWAAVSTRGLQQTGNDVFAGLKNTQSLIQQAQTAHARVVVLPEAALNDMLPGTVAMVRSAIPPNQTWLVGSEDGQHDAVWAFTSDKPPVMASDSVLPMPISMWRPWDGKVSYQPEWHKSAYTIDGVRVWSSICYEQVVPWIWVEAAIANPQVVLLQSNAWWSRPSNPAPAIQQAQALAYVRLLGVPAFTATNISSKHAIQNHDH